MCSLQVRNEFCPNFTHSLELELYNMKMRNQDPFRYLIHRALQKLYLTQIADDMSATRLRL